MVINHLVKYSQADSLLSQQMSKSLAVTLGYTLDRLEIIDATYYLDMPAKGIFEKHLQW